MEPLALEAPPVMQEFVFTNLMVADQNSVLVMGGQRVREESESHGHAFMVQVESGKMERIKLRHREKMHFESVFYRNRLFLIGGVGREQQLEDSLEVHEFNVDRLHFKRHVCASCRLYYDEEWVRSSREVFPLSRFKDDHDYNYHLKLDNRVLAKLAAYIPAPLHALTLLLQALHSLSATSLILALNSHRPSPHPSIEEESHRSLRVGCLLENYRASDLLT